MARRLSRSRPDPILLLKMTPGVATEARALAGKGSTADLGRRAGPRGLRQKDVLVIHDSRKPDTFVRGRERLDLATESGRARFIEILRLPAARAKLVQRSLAKADDDARDELAQLARLLAWAERGQGPAPRRIVLSGHAAYRGVRGEYDGRSQNGAVRLDDLKRLMQAFPTAAGQVRHLMIAACFVVGSGDLDGYREIFPNLVDVAGYGAKAPSSRSPQSALHLRRWARATRRHGDAPLTRAEVFGRCARAEPAETRRASHRAYHATLITAKRGAERCPTR